LYDRLMVLLNSHIHIHYTPTSVFNRRPPPRSTLFPYTTLFRSTMLRRSTRGQRHLAQKGVNLLRRRCGGYPAPVRPGSIAAHGRSEEHTSELQSRENLVCRLLLEKKKKQKINDTATT